MHRSVPQSSIPSIEHEGLGILWAELSSANADSVAAPKQHRGWRDG
jgi:hypothetical protein